MRIIITGGPGTGKTSIAKALAKKLSCPLIDVKRIVDDGRLFAVRGGEKEVDIPRLKRKLVSVIGKKRDFVLEGHLACEMRLPADFIFVLRCNPVLLRKRMSKRGYPVKKIEDNVMSEMLDYCSQRVIKEYRKTPLELDTSARSVVSCVRELEKAIMRKKKKLDRVDYTDELMAFLRVGR